MPGPLARLLPYALSFFTSLSLMVLELVASRLVARHVGASLIVWTSVIGIILAGICLGNVLGGRLADRVEPRRALGPLYALAAALTVACLWMNAYVDRLPGMSLLPWDLRTVLIVALDFLVPATVLGMISPVVAKMAVEQSGRAGSAIGDVYFLGAVGSIVGTFLAGFWLIYIAPTSTIVAIVAASLALLAAGLASTWLVSILSLGGCLFLVLGSLESIRGLLIAPGLFLGSLKVNAWALAGHALTVASAVAAWTLGPRLRPVHSSAAEPLSNNPFERPRLGDLAALAFLASLAFMALEMLAGRLVSRHLGSSVFSWTSVIGVLLGGLSLGNYLGGKLADRIRSEKAASHLFLVASIAVAAVILAESPPRWLLRIPLFSLAQSLPGEQKALLRMAMTMPGYPWWFCVLFWTGVVFFIPALTMGTVSPVVAKLAVDRARRFGRTGSAIGQVYAWGMVGSLVGTFLTGFLLIDVLGTKGLILVLATSLAVAATALGSVWHAVWAGIPLGLCLIAFVPPLLPEGDFRDFFVDRGRSWGLREAKADPYDADAEIAYLDESNYYYIKVENSQSPHGLTRTLVLDNLIHGYFVLGSPKVLDYDYEHLYAYVTDRVLQAKAKADGKPSSRDVELGTLFLGGGSYTFPRYLQAIYPKTWAEVAEIDPAVTHANHAALGLPPFDRTLPTPRTDSNGDAIVDLQGTVVNLGPADSPGVRDRYFEALGTIAPDYRKDDATGEGFAVIDGKESRFGPFDAEASRLAYVEAVAKWYRDSKYTIRTTWGDARQFVVRHEGPPIDIIYGDAFNDFSVPWHLTTREFNDHLADLLSPQGVYMINIIDVYESDTEAAIGAPGLTLNRQIAEAIGDRWPGERNAENVAASVYINMLSTELAGTLDDAAEKAAEALMANQRAMSRAELYAIVDAAVAPEAGDPRAVPKRSDQIKGAEQAMAEERATEILDAFDEVQNATRLEFENQKNATFAPKTVALSLDAIRIAGQTEPLAADRSAAIDDTFARCIKAAETLATSEPRALQQTINAIRSQVIEGYDENAQPETRTRILAVMKLLDAVRDAAEQETLTLRDGVDPVLANQSAVAMSSEVARVLKEVRSTLRGRSRSILDLARGDHEAAEKAALALTRFTSNRSAWVNAIVDSVVLARSKGAFLGAWVNTARLTFPHVYVFGTIAQRGSGGRETFVVVASRTPIDVEELGRREGEPKFTINGHPDEPEVFGQADMRAVEIRSRGIILTDDYAPIENLLVPVAETRAKH